MPNTINNSASITYTHGTNTDSALSNVVTTNLIDSYSLTAEKTSLNNEWRPGENITYLIRVENEGTEPLFAVSVQDNLGDNTTRPLTYLDESIVMLRNDILTEVTPTSTSPLTAVIPNALQPGEVVYFMYVAKVRNDVDDARSEITNEVTVVGHETSDSGPTVTVTPPPSLTLPKADYADVTIEKSVDKDEIAVGEELTYTFRLENNGNIEATNVVITDELPENFQVQSITAETNGVTTTFDAADYSLDADNKLILPTSVTKTISIPAKTTSGSGLTTVTIVGTITA